MLTRKKSIGSRTRLARRKQSKFLTPDLVLFRRTNCFGSSLVRTTR